MERLTAPQTPLTALTAGGPARGGAATWPQAAPQKRHRRLAQLYEDMQQASARRGSRDYSGGEQEADESEGEGNEEEDYAASGEPCSGDQLSHVLPGLTILQ